MPLLTLKFDDRELQHVTVGPQPVTIGRLPDNMLVIDNPAVSGRHARVVREGNHFVVEDLKSTNGTFVNDKPIARHTLLDGDEVLIGKHTVVFTLAGGDELETEDADAKAPLPELGGTMMLDTERQKSIMAALEQGRPSQMHHVVPRTAIPTAPPRNAALRVISGKTDQTRYPLNAVTTLIGKADTAQVRLRGWFKPKLAAAVARKGDGFTITPMDAKVSVNRQRLAGRHDLREGDLIEVAGLTLQFTLE
jgi:pSer/pThr/pTyr-binding forkhead associated (FHA) protein